METDKEVIAETSEAELKEGGFHGQKLFPLGINNPSA